MLFSEKYQEYELSSSVVILLTLNPVYFLPRYLLRTVGVSGLDLFSHAGHAQCYVIDKNHNGKD
jgi:hypothetical protein